MCCHCLNILCSCSTSICAQCTLRITVWKKSEFLLSRKKTHYKFPRKWIAFKVQNMIDFTKFFQSAILWIKVRMTFSNFYTVQCSTLLWRVRCCGGCPFFFVQDNPWEKSEHRNYLFFSFWISWIKMFTSFCILFLRKTFHIFPSCTELDNLTLWFDVKSILADFWRSKTAF